MFYKDILMVAETVSLEPLRRILTFKWLLMKSTLTMDIPLVLFLAAKTHTLSQGSVVIHLTAAELLQLHDAALLLNKDLLNPFVYISNSQS